MPFSMIAGISPHQGRDKIPALFDGPPLPWVQNARTHRMGAIVPEYRHVLA